MQENFDTINILHMQESLIKDSHKINESREALKSRIEAFLKMHGFSFTTLIAQLLDSDSVQLSKVSLWYTLTGQRDDQKTLEQALTYARQHSILEPYRRHPNDPGKVA